MSRHEVRLRRLEQALAPVQDRHAALKRWLVNIGRTVDDNTELRMDAIARLRRAWRWGDAELATRGLLAIEQAGGVGVALPPLPPLEGGPQFDWATWAERTRDQARAL